MMQSRITISRRRSKEKQKLQRELEREKRQIADTPRERERKEPPTRRPPPRRRSPSRSVTPPPRRSPPAHLRRRPVPSPSPDKSPSPAPARRRRTDSMSKPSKLSIGNLTRNINKDHILEIFSVYGRVRSIDLPLDKMNLLPRGTAYGRRLDRRTGSDCESDPSSGATCRSTERRQTRRCQQESRWRRRWRQKVSWSLWWWWRWGRWLEIRSLSPFTFCFSSACSQVKVTERLSSPTRLCIQWKKRLFPISFADKSWRWSKKTLQ